MPKAKIFQFNAFKMANISVEQTSELELSILFHPFHEVKQNLRGEAGCTWKRFWCFLAG